VVVDDMAEPREGLFQVFFQDEAGMIGADGDTHNADCTVRFHLSARSFPLRVER
jgi:hypothetical protein